MGCPPCYVVRFNALSRLIESALQKEGIPNRILGGHKFFERLEVRAYSPLCVAFAELLGAGERPPGLPATHRQPALRPGLQQSHQRPRPRYRREGEHFPFHGIAERNR